MTTVILFGNPRDPELQRSINRIAIGGRKVEVKPHPTFDTGLGQCGKHLCSCKDTCEFKYLTPVRILAEAKQDPLI